LALCRARVCFAEPASPIASSGRLREARPSSGAALWWGSLLAFLWIIRYQYVVVTDDAVHNNSAMMNYRRFSWLVLVSRRWCISFRRCRRFRSLGRRLIGLMVLRRLSTKGI